MQKYRDAGFVEYGDSGWRVTPDAAHRFGIELPEAKAATDCESVAAHELSSAERV